MKEIGKKVLEPYMSPVMAVAFSIGSAIGWGSLVVTSSGYLGKAGFAGSIIGLVLGMVVMLIIARNYSYLMQIYPETGGAYAFSREIFGHDYGFLTAWFLILTYLSISMGFAARACSADLTYLDETVHDKRQYKTSVQYRSVL